MKALNHLFCSPSSPLPLNPTGGGAPSFSSPSCPGSSLTRLGLGDDHASWLSPTPVTFRKAAAAGALAARWEGTHWARTLWASSNGLPRPCALSHTCAWKCSLHRHRMSEGKPRHTA